MLSVDACVDRVERELLEGRLRCPTCGGVLGPWWRARERSLRDGRRVWRIQPRRSRCRACRRTHVLLPVVVLERRADLVWVIGEALERKAVGDGYRRISRRLGVAVSTVRGWVDRFVSRAELIRVHFTVLAYLLDRSLAPVVSRGGGLGDAVEAVGVAARAAAQVWGLGEPWSFVSGVTGGRLLETRPRPFPTLR